MTRITSLNKGTLATLFIIVTAIPTAICELGEQGSTVISHVQSSILKSESSPVVLITLVMVTTATIKTLE